MKTKEKKWSTFWTYYAKFHGNTPDKQFDIDREEWPGGSMCGFILWIEKHKEEFEKKYPEAMMSKRVIGDNSAWAAYLNHVSNAQNCD